MNTLTAQVRHGAEQAWASLYEGWRDVRKRASGALTRFRRDAKTDAEEPTSGHLDHFEWGLMAADIRLDGNLIVVRIETPGLQRDDLHIDIDGDQLCVWGEKRIDTKARRGDYHLVQCAYGSFRRDLTLPQPVDADRAKASYLDGVLRIEIPTLDRSRGHRIEVQGD